MSVVIDNQDHFCSGKEASDVAEVPLGGNDQTDPLSAAKLPDSPRTDESLGPRPILLQRQTRLA
jgi:hypothetical protein